MLWCPDVEAAVAKQEEAPRALGDGDVGRSGREGQQTGQGLNYPVNYTL